MRLLLVVAVLLSLVGCASVSAIVTGKTRPAIDPSAVKLYSTAPKHYEDVAILSSKANSGLTAQGKVDNAVAGLKKKAAQLGANGVLIEASGTQNGGAVAIPSGNGFVLAPVENQVVQGRAIFVSEE